MGKGSRHTYPRRPSHRSRKTWNIRSCRSASLPALRCARAAALPLPAHVVRISPELCRAVRQFHDIWTNRRWKTAKSVVWRTSESQPPLPRPLAELVQLHISRGIDGDFSHIIRHLAVPWRPQAPCWVPVDSLDGGWAVDGDLTRAYAIIVRNSFTRRKAVTTSD